MSSLSSTCILSTALRVFTTSLAKIFAALTLFSFANFLHSVNAFFSSRRKFSTLWEKRWQRTDENYSHISNLLYLLQYCVLHLYQLIWLLWPDSASILWRERRVLSFLLELLSQNPIKSSCWEAILINTVMTLGKSNFKPGCTFTRALKKRSSHHHISWKLLWRANFFRVEGSVGTFVRTDDSTICRGYASYGIIEGSETGTASKNKKWLTSTKNCSTIFKKRSETLPSLGK